MNFTHVLMSLSQVCSLGPHQITGASELISLLRPSILISGKNRPNSTITKIEGGSCVQST